MANIRSEVAHINGVPLGGIGTGTVEVRPDGHFHDWQVFNLGRWAQWLPDACRDMEPEMGPGALSFYLRTESAATGPRMRLLGLRGDQNNLYWHTAVKNVRAINFQGQFPSARLEYEDEDLPVDISSCMFSPFIPHDARTSGTPGFYVSFRVRNAGKERVTASLLSTLKNPLAWKAGNRRLVNNISRDGRTTLLTMRTSAKAPCMATMGSLGLSATGGEASWMLGEYSNGYFQSARVKTEPGAALPLESLVIDFLEEGKLASRGQGRSPSNLLRMTDEAIASLKTEEVDALVDRLRGYMSFNKLWETMCLCEKKLMRTREGRNTYLRNIRARLNAHDGEDRKNGTWGSCALASSIDLAPGEEQDVVFTVGWFFPNQVRHDGVNQGHMYENWFDDAEQVNRFLAANYVEHRNRAVGFSEALFDTSLPSTMADAWAGQLTTLTKATWWNRKGEFGVWEGLGCCGFHTTDITYQGSFNILALFPELQLGQMKMGARFQREDGRVHHFFNPDFDHVDDGFDRVDMNQQFVMLVCRDYLWTGNKRFLREMWPRVLKAMKNTAKLDLDGDGLPDDDTRRNTYDAWNFRGTPSYIASLWLSALLAGIRLAEELGEKRQASTWRQMLKNGTASFEKKLWNGEYYSLWVDGELRDECCMTDQLSGEWFTQVIGLGHALPRDRVVAALKAVAKYNYSKQYGLINANYPPGSQPRLSTYKNFQQRSPWTGIEYATASMMLEFGLSAEAMGVVGNVHDRYLRAGRLWNHTECGDHYYRAMSSWAVLLSATGFKVDRPRSSVSFAPAIRHTEFRAPWVSSAGWGSFALARDKFTLACVSGRLEFKELRLKSNASKPQAIRNGRRVSCSAQRNGGTVKLSFRSAVRLGKGDHLVVTW